MCGLVCRRLVCRCLGVCVCYGVRLYVVCPCIVCLCDCVLCVVCCVCLCVSVSFCLFLPVCVCLFCVFLCVCDFGGGGGGGGGVCVCVCHRNPAECRGKAGNILVVSSKEQKSRVDEKVKACMMPTFTLNLDDFHYPRREMLIFQGWAPSSLRHICFIHTTKKYEGTFTQ